MYYCLDSESPRGRCEDRIRSRRNILNKMLVMGAGGKSRARRAVFILLYPELDERNYLKLDNYILLFPINQKLASYFVKTTNHI